MGEDFPAHLVVFVPERGHKGLARLFLRNKKDPNRKEKAQVALHGGVLVLHENQASGGVHQLRDDLPPSIDYNHHNDGKYEYPALYEWCRRGRVTTRHNDPEGTILLSLGDIERILRAASAKKGATRRLREVETRLRAEFVVPSPSYKVGPHEYEEHID